MFIASGAAPKICLENAAFRSYNACDVIATMDTHSEDYLITQEGKNLPVAHCIRGTEGWEIRSDIAALIADARIYEKPTFGSVQMATDLAALSEK